MQRVVKASTRTEPDGSITVLTQNMVQSNRGIPCPICEYPLENFMAMIPVADSDSFIEDIEGEFEGSTVCPECRHTPCFKFNNGQYTEITGEQE